MRPKEIDLAEFTAQEVKGATAEKREGGGVFLSRRIVIVEVKSRVIPTGFLKIKRRKRLVGMGTRKKKASEKNGEVVKTPVLKHFPGAEGGRRGRRQVRNDYQRREIA